MTQRPKPDAIGKPDVFDDSLSPAQIANIEANATNLKDVISALLSQMKRIMRGNNAGDWKDDPTVVARSLQDLNDAAVMPNPTGTDGRAITEEGSVSAYRNVKASALIGGFQSVADAAARDAIPAGQRTEGMLVRTNDTKKLWALSANLTTWTEVVSIQSFRVVANTAARDAIPADERVEGMIVVQLDSMQWWQLYAPLTNNDWLSPTVNGLYVEYDGINNSLIGLGGGDLTLSFTGSIVSGSPVTMQAGLTVQGNADVATAGGAVATLGNTAGNVQYVTARQTVALPFDDGNSGAVSAMPGGPYTSLGGAIKNALVLGKAAGARFLTGASPQLIYVNPSTGLDTNDGLTSGTPFQTIQRAIDDIPSGFKTDVIVQLSAGSFSGQNVSVTIAPGFNPGTNTSSQIYIVGERTPAFTTGATGSGVLVAGKTSQIQYTGAGVSHGLTITDGSHWVYTGTTTAVPASIRVLRTSSTTDLIVVQNATTSFSARNICTYNTTFTSTFRFGCHSLSVTDSPFVHLIGIKFNALGSITRASFQGCNVNTGAASIIQDSNIFSGYWGTDVTLFDGNHGRRTTFNSLFAAKVNLNGARSSLQQCVFASSLAAGNAMLSLGTTSTTEPPVQTTSPSGVRLVSAVDFEGTGNGVQMAGMSYFIFSGNVSFALTGRAFIMNEQCSVNASASSTISGTVTLPISIRNGSRWSKGGGGITFSLSNTLNPGQDIALGGADGFTTVIAASGTAVDATELCSYL